MRSDQKINAWLDMAVDGIKFSPDRKAVRRELREHMEDKALDLQRIFPDMTEEEAQARALSGMGDAEEIGRALAKLHKPWLGYLWRLSQAVLAVSVFLLLISGALTGLWDSWGVEKTSTERQGIVLLAPDETQVRTDGFTIRMTEAYCWTQDYPEGERRVSITLRRSSPMFWCKENDYGSSWDTFLTAEDSMGNLYSSYQERWNEPGDTELWKFVWPGWREEHLFYTDHELMIPLKDPDVEWVRLNYDRLDRRFSFTVYLKEAGT